MRPGNVNCDFYVYLTPVSGFVIDVFYAQDIRSLTRIVQIKLSRYSLIDQETYLVLVGNDSILQQAIDQKMNNRKNLLPKHIRVMTEEMFRDLCYRELVKRSEFSII